MSAAELQGLAPAELNNLAEGLQCDLQLLSESAQKLQGAVARFHQSGVALEALEEETPGAPAALQRLRSRPALTRFEQKGTPMLVPLTQSRYAPGKLGDNGKVLIDIGTGYFVEVRRSLWSPPSARVVAAAAFAALRAPLR